MSISRAGGCSVISRASAGCCRDPRGGDNYDLAGRPSVFAGPTDVLYTGIRRDLTVSPGTGGRVAVASARNLFWALDRAEEAEAVLQEAHHRVGDGAAHVELFDDRFDGKQAVTVFERTGDEVDRVGVVVEHGDDGLQKAAAELEDYDRRRVAAAAAGGRDRGLARALNSLAIVTRNSGGTERAPYGASARHTFTAPGGTHRKRSFAV